MIKLLKVSPIEDSTTHHAVLLIAVRDDDTRHSVIMAWTDDEASNPACMKMMIRNAVDALSFLVSERG